MRRVEQQIQGANQTAGFGCRGNKNAEGVSTALTKLSPSSCQGLISLSFILSPQWSLSQDGSTQREMYKTAIQSAIQWAAEAMELPNCFSLGNLQRLVSRFF